MGCRKDGVRRSGRGNWQLLWLILILLAAAGAGLANSQQLLLNTARTPGSNLVSSWSAGEDSQLSEYGRILTTGMYYPEDMDKAGVDPEAFKVWLTDLFERISAAPHRPV